MVEHRLLPLPCHCAPVYHQQCDSVTVRQCDNSELLQTVVTCKNGLFSKTRSIPVMICAIEGVTRVRSAHTPPQTQPQSVRYSVEAARRSASSLLSSGSEANASDLRTIAFDFASRAAAASMPFVRLGNLPFKFFVSILTIYLSFMETKINLPLSLSSSNLVGMN